MNIVLKTVILNQAEKSSLYSKSLELRGCFMYGIQAYCCGMVVMNEDNAPEHLKKKYKKKAWYAGYKFAMNRANELSREYEEKSRKLYIKFWEKKLGKQWKHVI